MTLHSIVSWWPFFIKIETSRSTLKKSTMATHCYNTRFRDKNTSYPKDDHYSDVNVDDESFNDALMYYDDELEHSWKLDIPSCMNPTRRVCRYETLADLFEFYLNNMSRLKNWGPNTKNRILRTIESLVHKKIPRRLNELTKLLALSSKEAVQKYELERLSKALSKLHTQLTN